MALSKEFYLDEIRSKYPNSYNEGLKDLPVKDLEDMLDFLEQALGKADGGAIGIEVLFTDKKPRKNFFMGGPALEGQALDIYNSMNAYGFSDQEIADALSARGLYTAAGSGTTTQPEQVTGIIGSQLNQGGDKPMIQPFQQDPRVGSAFEAYQRNQALSAMGINDPFANEATLAGAYYGDMPNVNLQPGSQTFMGKVKSKLDSLVDLSPTLNFVKGIGQGIANIFPVNQRAIAENVAGNMGIAVDNIGRVVNTGDYNDPSNVMAGYNLNKMTDETFDKRIDNISQTLSNKYGLGTNEITGILEGTLTDEELDNINAKAIMPGTTQTTNLIKQLRSINIAKDRNKFIQETARKEAERQERERDARRKEKAFQSQLTQQQRDQRQRDLSTIEQAYRDFAAGRDDSYSSGSAGVQADGSYNDPFDPGGGEKDGGFIDGYNRRKYSQGGLATMFTRRR